MASATQAAVPFPGPEAAIIDARDGANGKGVASAALLNIRLRKVLSPKATIESSTHNAPRWSDYGAPKARHVVNVATQRDVAAVVKYCVENDLRFIAQSGAHGWADTFTLREKDIIINLRQLNEITVASNKKSATIGGGALTGEVINATYDADVRVQVGNCDEVGALGGILGGGLGRTMGLYGLGVDNVLSLNVVNSEGELKTITPGDKDLWWALRGAGPNFGIVTSAKLKAYQVPKAENSVWLGALIFSPDHLPALAEAYNKLEMSERMAIFLYFATGGPPDFTPSVISFPYFLGTEAEGKEAFKSIYEIGPLADMTASTPYNLVNAGGAPFNVKGGRKPAFGAGLGRLDGAVLTEIWGLYTEFLKHNGTGASSVLMEQYSHAKARSFGEDSASYPHREHVRIHAVALPWYEDKALDPQAEVFGKKVRDLLVSKDGLKNNSTYINFAHGDEPLETIYGDSLPRLRKIKKREDPDNVFGQWFPLSR